MAFFDLNTRTHEVTQVDDPFALRPFDPDVRPVHSDAHGETVEGTDIDSALIVARRMDPEAWYSIAVPFATRSSTEKA